MNDTELKELILEEGNFFQDTYKGFKYCILRAAFEAHSELQHPLIHLCGYVEIKKGSSYYISDDYDDYDDKGIFCHGGLTYSGNIGYKDFKMNFCIGFDCCHPGDKAMLGRKLFSEEAYRDMEYVKKECKSVIDQLIKLTSVSVLIPNLKSK